MLLSRRHIPHGSYGALLADRQAPVEARTRSPL
jgi:hypothetical protein